MVAGKLVLAKLVVVPAGIVYGVTSLFKASEINEAAAKLEKTNFDNGRALAIIDERHQRIIPLEFKLTSEINLLEDVLDRVECALFPWGFLSRFWRTLRSRFGTPYYSHREYIYVNEVEGAARSFFSAFGQNSPL